MCHMRTKSRMVFLTFTWGHDKDSLLLAKILGKEKKRRKKERKKHFRSRAGKNKKVGLKKFSKETGHYVNGLCMSLGGSIVGF